MPSTGLTPTAVSVPPLMDNSGGYGFMPSNPVA
jgi:hypothetical protein